MSDPRRQPTRNAPSIMRPHACASLFDDELPTGSSLTGVLAQRKPANKAQKIFRQLVARIETKREDREMGVEIARIEVQIRDLSHDLTTFRDPNYLRETLKHYQLESDFVDPEESADLFDVLAPVHPMHAGKKRRRK